MYSNKNNFNKKRIMLALYMFDVFISMIIVKPTFLLFWNFSYESFFSFSDSSMKISKFSTTFDDQLEY